MGAGTNRIREDSTQSVQILWCISVGAGTDYVQYTVGATKFGGSWNRRKDLFFFDAHSARTFMLREDGTHYVQVF